MLKNIKKLLISLLVLFILVGCSNNTKKIEKVDDVSYYLNLLTNFEVKKKDKNNTEDNKEFIEFEDEVFKKLISTNYLTMNAYVLDYKALGIEKPDRKLFDIKYGDTTYRDTCKEILEKLQSFDYDLLSYKQQYDYDAMRYDMIQTIIGEYFSIYEQPLNISNDIIGNTITNLVEFHFNDIESFDDYLELLNSFPECMEDVLEYTSIQYENGIGLTDTIIEYNIDLINSCIDKVDDNQMLTNFVTALNKSNFNIDKDAYINKAKETLINVVIPSLNKVKEELTKYTGTTDESSVLLANINKDFATYKFYEATSTNEDPETYFEKLKEFVAKETDEVYDSLNDFEAITIYSDILTNGLDVLKKPYEEILNDLNDNYKKAYPSIGDIPYSITKLDATVQDNVLAYYVPMPVDNININTIKVNGSSVSDGSLELYTTLAHEGIPGHLYQFYYCASNGISKYRMISYPIAYCEGHTVTAQREALNWLGIKNKNAINLIKYDTSSYFFTNSLIDIGIHNFAWSVDEVKEMLDETLGEYNSDAVEDAYKYLVGCPGMYLKYGGGALNFYLLRKHAEEELKDKFDLVKFNEAMLRNGPLPYPILKYSIDEYIEENR